MLRTKVSSMQLWTYNGTNYITLNTDKDYTPWRGYWIPTLEGSDDIP